jgi:hypothetical protein
MGIASLHPILRAGCASAASNSGVIVLVDEARNSGPYCHHVSGASLSSR